MIPIAWLITGAAAVAVVAGAYYTGYDHGFNELRADWNEQQLVQSREFATRLKDVNEQLEVMRVEERRKDETYEDRLRTISRQRDAATASLRDRPERAAVPASGPAAQAAAGTAGSIIYRRDAEALIDLAARADELRAALERCQGGDVAADGGRMDR